MNQTETLERKSPFSFSELRKKVARLREKKIFGFESNLVGRIPLPIGVSLLAVAQRSA